jgi:hypothetical protein
MDSFQKNVGKFYIYRNLRSFFLKSLRQGIYNYLMNLMPSAFFLAGSLFGGKGIASFLLIEGFFYISKT